MSRFDRYLLSQLLAVFGFFSLVLVSVYWINRAVGLFDRLIGDGQTALVFLEFSLLTLPNVIALVLPISAFAAALYVTNRLKQESELVVMQSSGFSAFRLARPVMYFGLIVAAMMLILTQGLVPASRTELARRTAEISQNVTARFLTDGQFTHPAPGLTLYIRKVASNGELQHLFLADDRDPAARSTYSARRALFERTDTGPRLLMFDGMAQILSSEGQRLSVTRFADFTYELTGLFNKIDSTARITAQLSTVELFSQDPGLIAETGSSAAEFLAVAHNRFAQPLLATAAAMIGFAALLLGNQDRFGLWWQIGVAIALLILVQAVTTYAGALAASMANGWVLTYVGPVLGSGIAAGLLWLAQRPRRVATGAAQRLPA